MFLKSWEKNFDKNFNFLLTERINKNMYISSSVKKIINLVKVKKNKGLLDCIKKYDGFDFKTTNQLLISHKTLKKAYENLNIKKKKALLFAFRRIKTFHQKQLPNSFHYKDKLGVQLGMYFNKIDSCCFYVPGGKAIYPSSILMNVIPALVAGVSRKVLVSPISITNPPEIVLAAAYLTKIDEFYVMGGAHSIAAFAYGTETIKKVDKIVGPGNNYVAEAKRQVFGNVSIDSVAGPSEVLILSDNKTNPDWVAFDLLSQSEHDESAQSILITNDLAYGNVVKQRVEKHLLMLSRKKIAMKSWKNHGAIIIVRNLKDAVPIINKVAPEHLQICLDKPKTWLKLIKNAGSIFLGRMTPEAIGDYVAGPNHVLPTGGTAKFSSGLGVYDFLKRSTFVQCDDKNFKILSKHARVLALEEGLDAHEKSMKIRE